MDPVLHHTDHNVSKRFFYLTQLYNTMNSWYTVFESLVNISTFQGTVESLKTQLTAMAREIAAIKSRPQSSGAVSTKPVSGTLMEVQMYVFMGEYISF